ncbi:MAG: hypothetical protein RBT65_08855 [Methanolobus sp.]|nr:hypothetical protein [Methanolobus sp.]
MVLNTSELNFYSPLISVIVTLALVLVTIYYAWSTSNMLKQSKADTKIAYSRSQLENYYYPLLSFFDMCQKEKQDSETIAISFNMDNKAIFNIIHKYQYLANEQLREEIDMLVPMLTESIQDKGKCKKSTSKLDNNCSAKEISSTPIVSDYLLNNHIVNDYFAMPPNVSVNNPIMPSNLGAYDFAYVPEELNKPNSFLLNFPLMDFSSAFVDPSEMDNEKLITIKNTKIINQFTETEKIVRNDIKNLIRILDKLTSKNP